MASKDLINLSAPNSPKIFRSLKKPYLPWTSVSAAIYLNEHLAPLNTGIWVNPRVLKILRVFSVAFFRLRTMTYIYLVFPKLVEIPTKLDFGWNNANNIAIESSFPTSQSNQILTFYISYFINR